MYVHTYLGQLKYYIIYIQQSVININKQSKIIMKAEIQILKLRNNNESKVLNQEIVMLKALIETKNREIQMLCELNRNLNEKLENEKEKNQIMVSKCKDELASLKLDKLAEKHKKSKIKKEELDKIYKLNDQKILQLTQNYQKSIMVIEENHEKKLLEVKNNFETQLSIQKMKSHKMEVQNKQLLTKLHHEKLKMEDFEERFMHDYKKLQAEEKKLIEKINQEEESHRKRESQLEDQIALKKQEGEKLQEKIEQLENKIAQMQMTIKNKEKQIKIQKDLLDVEERKRKTDVEKLKLIIEQKDKDLAILCRNRNQFIERPPKQIEIKPDEIERKYLSYIEEMQKNLSIKSEEIQSLTKKLEEYRKYINLDVSYQQKFSSVSFGAETTKKLYNHFLKDIKIKASNL